MSERRWHPIMQAREYQPGRWVMVDSSDRTYALIDIVRIGGEVGYKATTCAVEPSERKLIGYFTSLSASAERAHGLWIGRSTPHGPPNGNTRWPVRDDPWS